MLDVFQFRDFSMRQAPVGQRINTDSCVFGAVVGDDQSRPERILDIGAGTGVVTLMVAHRFPNARVIAVEPEPSVADVAQANFDTDLWKNRVGLLRRRIQDLDPAQCGRFDLVLCNPPYFQNSRLSADRATALARHNCDMSPEEIYASMLRFMLPDATAWLSFPECDSRLWLKSGEELGLHPFRQIILSEHQAAKPHVVIAGWTTKPTGGASPHVTRLLYRTAPQGELSPWMKSFRKQWFPAQFNKNSYAVDPD